MGRIVLAGVLAGLALFAWGVVSHLILGLDQKWIRNLPDEEAVAAVLEGTVQESGFYFFPGMPEASKSGTPEQKEAANKAWEEWYATRPHGIVVYNQPKGPLNFGRLMGVQVGVDLLVGVLAALLLSISTPITFGGRFLFVLLIGVVSWLAVVVPFWNWYDFPSAFMTSQLVDQLGGSAAAGAVLGAMVKSRARV